MTGAGSPEPRDQEGHRGNQEYLAYRWQPRVMTLARGPDNGTRRIYRLNPIAVAALRDQLDAFWRRALESYADVAGQATEERS